MQRHVLPPPPLLDSSRMRMVLLHLSGVSVQALYLRFSEFLPPSDLWMKADSIHGAAPSMALTVLLLVLQWMAQHSKL
jgi:hypothetical protein